MLSFAPSIADAAESLGIGGIGGIGGIEGEAVPNSPDKADTSFAGIQLPIPSVHTRLSPENVPAADICASIPESNGPAG